MSEQIQQLNNKSYFFSNIDLIAFNNFLIFIAILYISALVIIKFSRKIPISIVQIIIFSEIFCFLLGLSTYVYFTVSYNYTEIEIILKSIIFVTLFVLFIHYLKDGACRVILACLIYNPKADARIKLLLAKEKLSDQELEELYKLRRQSSETYFQTIEQKHHISIEEETLDPESASEAILQDQEREFEASDAMYQEELKILQNKDN